MENKMNEKIHAKMKALEVQQDQFNAKLKEIDETVKKLNEQRTQILTEGFRMQGEYRGLKGLLDEAVAVAPANGSQSVAAAN